MDRTISSPTPSLFADLDGARQEPLYRQIYSRIRGAIADGMLRPGDRIPAARALAAELGLARGTIETAYALLTAEGYVQARGPAGTVVTPRLQTAGLRTPRKAHPAPSAFMAPTPAPLPFQMGMPALDAFPRKTWARVGAKAVRGADLGDMGYPAESGQPALRAAIATYLQVSRGIACAPSQVFVTAGYRDSLGLIFRALLHSGEGVWVEDPCFPPTVRLLTEAGAAIHPVRVDEEGMDVAAGIAHAPQARAVVVTPAHQSPLCMTLSLSRRLALLAWAAQTGAWVVEDDYDGEYRYASRPLPALKSLDREGRVLYAGTFSKVLFPGLRLAYVVVPDAQVDRFEQTCRTFQSGGAALMQTIVASFMTEGHFARHIQRMRKLYAERREQAEGGLRAVLGQHLLVAPQPGGMHLVARPQGTMSAKMLAARMVENGMRATALSDWTLHPRIDDALLLGFTNIVDEAEARVLAGRILALLG